MRARAPIFGLLLNEPNLAVEPALLAALPGADEVTARGIIETLLARDQKAGLSGLIANFHELAKPLKEVVLAAAEKLTPLLREAFQSRNEHIRLNVVELIRRGGLFRASYLLEAALHDPSTDVFTAAAGALHDLADRLVAEAAGTRARPEPAKEKAVSLPEVRRRMMELEARREDRRHIASALLAALSSARLHLQPALVEAAMWLAEDLGLKLWAVLSAPGGKALRLSAWVFETSRGPRMVPFAMAALHHAEFRPYILRALAVCTDGAFWEEWYRQCWRTHAPSVARNMAVVREAGCIGTRAEGLLSLSPAAQRRAAGWLDLTGVSLETKLSTLRELQRRGSAPRAAVWAICNIADPGAMASLGILATDQNRDTSMSARFELARRLPHQYRPKDLLSAARALNPQVERSVEEPEPEAEKPIRFEDYWANFDLMSDEERVAVGHELLLARPGTESLLRRQLTSPEITSRVRALRVIILLGRIEPFAEQVYPLAHDPQSEVRSAAVIALGKLGDPTSRLLLHGALLDPDARVQANAIEAVDALQEHFDPTDLLPKLNSPDNRVRANAVGALLKLGIREAAETLLQMLEDENRAQRISALWLVEQMGLPALAGRITQLAEGDVDEQVRSRARKLLQHMHEPAAGVAL